MKPTDTEARSGRFSRIGGRYESEQVSALIGRRRWAPISDNLPEWLQPIAQNAASINPSTNDRGLNHRLLRGPARSAQLAWVKNGLCHSFRSCRFAQASGAPKVALEAGNNTTMIFHNYRELVTPDEAQEWLSSRPKVGAL